MRVVAVDSGIDSVEEFGLYAGEKGSKGGGGVESLELGVPLG